MFKVRNWIFQVKVDLKFRRLLEGKNSNGYGQSCCQAPDLMDAVGTVISVNKTMCGSKHAGYRIAGMIGLFSKKLQRNGEHLCDFMWVWTGFKGILNEPHNWSYQKTRLWKKKKSHT